MSEGGRVQGVAVGEDAHSDDRVPPAISPAGLPARLLDEERESGIVPYHTAHLHREVKLTRRDEERGVRVPVGQASNRREMIHDLSMVDWELFNWRKDS